MAILIVIDTGANVCKRYSGKTMTHGFVIETQITPEMIGEMLRFPDTVGEPEGEENDLLA